MIIPTINLKEMSVVNTFKCFLLSFVINFVIFENCNGQNNQKMKSFGNVGIPISKNNFDSLVATSTSLMKRKNEDLSIDEFVAMIRLRNTITFFELSNQSYKKFIKLFTPDYLLRAAKALDATESKGMCFYSKGFDIYIGGTPHQNSQFLITNDH